MDVTLMLPTVNFDKESERDLVTACRQREVAAFETLYRRHGARLKSVAYHLLRNRPDAEDAVQEAFLNAYRSVHGFRGESTIGTWLCRIVVNVCNDKLRKDQNEVQLAVEPESVSPNRALRIALEDALQRIHPKHRMVFLLFEAEGYTHSEIASILDILEGTSKGWLADAKQELKRMLGARK